MWQQDPVMLLFKKAAKNVCFFGYADPPNAKASEAYSKYVVVDLFVKAIQGMPAEDSAKWAEAELKKIYGETLGSSAGPSAGGLPLELHQIPSRPRSPRAARGSPDARIGEGLL
jgi:hypothetical protein